MSNTKNAIEIKPEWEVFAREYVRDLEFNRNRAYEIAYNRDPKDKSISVSASRLLKKGAVRKRVQELLEYEFDNTDLIPEELINRLKSIIRWDVGSIISGVSGGSVIIKDWKDITKEQRYLIQDISSTNSGVRIKFIDRMKAFEMLGKYFKLFVDRIEHSGVVEHKLSLDLSKLTSDELREYKRLIEKAKTT